jgi:hypothetical protein
VRDQLTLTASEVQVARFLASLRHQNDRQAGVVNQRIGPQSDEFTDLNGLGGELAFCKLVNVWPDLTTEPRRGGYDCIVNGWRVDVKTTEYRGGKLVASLSKRVEDVDVFALVTGAFPGAYRIAGWAWAVELLQDHTIGNLGHGQGYILEQRELEPWNGLPARGTK